MIGAENLNALVSTLCRQYPETQFFQEKADEVMNDFTHVFKEVPEIMSLLKEQGFSPGIVSGKFRYRIESFLEREKLLDFFKVIVGGEDVVKHKPLYFSK